jgi:hypothetical protein
LTIVIHRTTIHPGQLPPAALQSGSQLKLLEGMQVAIGKIAGVTHCRRSIQTAAIESVDKTCAAAPPCINLILMCGGVLLAYISTDSREFGLGLEACYTGRNKVLVEHHIPIEKIKVITAGMLECKLCTSATRSF